MPGELPPPEVLQPLVKYSQDHPERLNLSFYVDSKDGSSAEAITLNVIHERRIEKADVQRALHNGRESSWLYKILRVASAKPTEFADKKVLFLVCGPEP